MRVIGCLLACRLHHSGPPHSCTRCKAARAPSSLSGQLPGRRSLDIGPRLREGHHLADPRTTRLRHGVASTTRPMAFDGTSGQHAHVYVCIYMYTYLFTYIYIYVCAHVILHIRYTHIQTFAYCIHTHACIYIYINICT